MWQCVLIVNLTLLAFFFVVMVPIGLLELFGVNVDWSTSFSILALKILMGTLALDALLAIVSALSLSVYWFIRDDLGCK